MLAFKISAPLQLHTSMLWMQPDRRAPGKEEEEEEEEGLYLRLETRKRVQTNEEEEERVYLQISSCHELRDTFCQSLADRVMSSEVYKRFPPSGM